MGNKVIISWDIGATKCAAALMYYNVKNNKLTCEKQHSIKLRDCASFAELTAQLEAALGLKMAEADAICIGAAGQYDGAELQHHVPYPYPMAIAETANAERWPAYKVVHDYTPIVCATFTDYMKHADNVRLLHNGDFDQYGRRVAIGIGTGLGVKDGVLLKNGDCWLGKNEMGHIGISHPPLANADQLQRHHALIHYMQSEGVLQHGQSLSFEMILSGQGMARLHHFVNQAAVHWTPEQVGDYCRAGEADETLGIFAWYLGLYIGTVQLSFMPSGGIWLTGGVLLKNLAIVDRPEFMQGIYASPAYRQQRDEFPLGILCNHEAAFWGGAYYAIQRLLIEF